MKSFFEEYGFVTLAAIVVILLIAMATPIGDLVKIQVSEVVNSFGSKTQSKLNATDGVINVRVSTANNKITLEWDANKKEDVFKYSYKASNTKGEANWTNKADVTINDKNRTVTIEKDSNDQPLANKTKVEYKIYDSNDQLVASGVVTAKIGKDATTGGSGETEISGVATGTKLTIEGKEYTVIEQVEGSKYKVLANELADNGSPMRFGDNSNYATSIIATYLDNDYYNSLPESVKNAIVETSIQQKVLKTWAGNNPTDWDTPRDGGKHKVFLPSWDEVKMAAGSTNKTALKTLLNSDTVWLRDAFGPRVFQVMSDGVLNLELPHYFYNGSGNYNFKYAHPAFVIDLSKVEYTIK